MRNIPNNFFTDLSQCLTLSSALMTHCLYRTPEMHSDSLYISVEADTLQYAQNFHLLSVLVHRSWVEGQEQWKQVGQVKVFGVS